MKKIKCLHIQIPEYAVNTYKVVSQDSPYIRWGKPVPIEYEENKPDFERVARRLIDFLRKHFPGERIGLRFISSSAHEDKSLQDLIEIIKETGTDRYDPNREGDRYANLDNLHIDFFALNLLLGEAAEEVCIKYALESFYYYPILNQGPPIRIDLGIVYDIHKIRPVYHRYIGREEEIKKDGFVFVDPHNRNEAVRAVIAIS